MTALNRHPDRAAALVLLFIALLLFAPYLAQPEMLMWPRSGLGTDLLTYNWPPVYFFRQSISQYGQIPLWQWTSLGGLPMVGNPAIRVFYPPLLLVTLLPIPIAWGYTLLNVLHFWLAGISGYFLARSTLKVNHLAAFSAGLLIMLTPRLSSNIVGDGVYTYGMCWLIPCLLWARYAFEQRSWRWGVAAGLALCCVYLTNIQFVLYAGWIIGLYFVYQCAVLLADRQPLYRLLRQVSIGVVILIASVGFSAFQSLPFASYLPYQSREAMTLTDSNFLALPVVGLFNVFFPIAQKFPEWEVYAGLLPLILTPLAILHTNRREARWWIGLLTFAILFSLGSSTPLYNLLFQFVPGFSLLRVPARMWFVATIALAMLASLGLDVLTRPGTKLNWRWLIGSSAILMLLTMAGRFLTRRPDELDWLLGILSSADLIVFLIGLWQWQHQRLAIAGLTVITTLTILTDLFPLDVAFATPRPVADFLALPPIGERLIEAAEGNDLYRVYSMRREIREYVAAAHNIQTAEGLNSFQFSSYSHFMRIATGCNLEGLAAAVPPCASDEISKTAYLNARPNPALLGLLNTRYIIAPYELVANQQLRLIAREADGYLYENLAHLPRAFAVGNAALADDVWAQLPHLDVQKTVLLESAINDLPQNDFFVPGQITAFTPNEIQAEVDMPETGILVLGEPWVNGWIAEVDGQSTETLRVNGALRGVHLKAGIHSVVFTFRPTAFLIGLLITVGTVSVSLMILLVDKLHPKLRR